MFFAMKIRGAATPWSMKGPSMRLLVAATLAFALAGSAARAERAPGICIVAVMSAPDDVRQTIEAWVHAEPRCGTYLEVRVVPIFNGFYLYARSADGRVRERVVPDAQSAGVLVASWSADDSIESEAIVSGGPGATPPANNPTTDGMPRRWLALEALTLPAGSGGKGLRAALDLHTHGAWSFGLVASALRTHDDIEGAGRTQYTDLGVGARVAFTGSRGAWDLRLVGGVGVSLTKADGHVMDYSVPTVPEYDVTGKSVGTNFEVSAQLWRRFGSIAIGGGPLATLVPQRVVNGEYAGQADRSLMLLIVGGIRFAL